MTIKCKKKRKEEEAFFCQNITISTVSRSAIDREVQTSPLNLKTLHLCLSISTYGNLKGGVLDVALYWPKLINAVFFLVLAFFFLNNQIVRVLFV